MVKELYLMLILGISERRKSEAPPYNESWGRMQQFEFRSDPKSPSLRGWLFPVQSVTVPVGHSLDTDPDPKKYLVPGISLSWTNQFGYKLA